MSFVHKVPSVFHTPTGNLIIIRAPMRASYTYVPNKYAEMLPRDPIALVLDLDEVKLSRVKLTVGPRIKGRNVTRVYVSRKFDGKNVVIIIPKVVSVAEG